MSDRPPRAQSSTVVPFTAGDGMSLNLIHVRGDRSPDKGPLLCVHGAGVRANIFRPPVETSFVDAAIDAGYDVWLENWRASIDFPRNEWTLDRAACYDHPAAVRTVAEATGTRAIKAVVHCQGSTSFMIAAVAGLLPEVRTILSNAVSLHPVVPSPSALKIKFALPLAGLMTRYIDAQWGNNAPALVPQLITAWVRTTHHECHNLVCKYASFTYGTGRPTLWSHENLNSATHEWVKQEFGACPLSFFHQMARSLAAGRLVPYEPLPGLPTSYVPATPNTDARIAFFAGADNVCFLPESQRRSFAYFDAHRPGTHSLTIIPGYGHLDVFMGAHAARDVFPLMLQELER
jgi:pimeloyl-ACP methyl ester carboxylesterase